ncbi:hypothetical protein Tco_0859793 [Tanacetum coccineum]|uniref:Uncharacterized protein n=1 Tax=Tanacetum coccineum TaxID=301880 RepID=A0ABQ5BGL8_9ASTR
MDGLDFCPLDQTRLICTYGWYVDAKDRTNGTNDEQYLLPRNEQGAVVNAAFRSEDDEATTACKSLFQNKTGS